MASITLSLNGAESGVDFPQLGTVTWSRSQNVYHLALVSRFMNRWPKMKPGAKAHSVE